MVFFRKSWSTDSSTVNVAAQEECVNQAMVEGAKAGLYSLGVSSAVILGACKLFPRFNNSLSVSSRTALIISPAIGAWALLTELGINDCARQRRHLTYATRAAADAASAAASAPARS